MFAPPGGEITLFKNKGLGIKILRILILMRGLTTDYVTWISQSGETYAYRLTSTRQKQESNIARTVMEGAARGFNNYIEHDQ